MKVKLLDDMVKNVVVENTCTVDQIVVIIGEKLRVRNVAEYSLTTEAGM